MKEDKHREEYVMNESGLIYAGTYDDMFTWPWNFAQVLEYRSSGIFQTTTLYRISVNNVHNIRIV